MSDLLVPNWVIAAFSVVTWLLMAVMADSTVLASRFTGVADTTIARKREAKPAENFITVEDGFSAVDIKE